MQVFNFSQRRRSRRKRQRRIRFGRFKRNRLGFIKAIQTVRNKILHLMQQRIRRVFVADKIKRVIRRQTPQANVFSTSTPPVLEQHVFVFGKSFFRQGILRRRESDSRRFVLLVPTGNRFAPDIFPEFHTRILDKSKDIMLRGKLLQNNAVKLAHTRKAENKHGLRPLRSIDPLREQIRNRQESRIAAGTLASRLENLRQQRFTLCVMEQAGIYFALPFFFRQGPIFFREKVAQGALFPIGEQALMMLVLQRRNESARTARFIFQEKACQRAREIK